MKKFKIKKSLIILFSFYFIQEASRGQVMKYLFAYIKEHGLKDSEDGRFFNPDKKMAKVFGKDKLRSFGMSKFIGKHLTDIE